MIGMGVIGYGYWGPNLVRNFEAPGARVVAVSDLRQERLALMQEDLKINGILYLSLNFWICSAVLSIKSSASITQGPEIKTKGELSPMLTFPTFT